MSASKRGNTITINPVTRIEGHMKVEAVVDGGRVKDARCVGTMFRGFENIIAGRYPVDAVRLSQRVCGVCPTVHGTASAMGLDRALGIAEKVPDNGRIVRNLLLGSNFLQSHILHFFALAALDYVDVAAAADYDGDHSGLKNVRAFIERKELSPFFPRYEGDYRCDKPTNLSLLRGYLQALHIRRITHEMLSIFGGKMPHNIAIVPGGVTVEVTPDKIATFFGKLQEVRQFIDDVYAPAILTVAKAYDDYFGIGRGCGRYLSYGTFDLDSSSSDPLSRKRLLGSGVLADGKVQAAREDKITEEVAHSRYSDACAAQPSAGSTVPEPGKPGAYSWLKAPRYDGAPAEVGPLARVLINYTAGHKAVRTEFDAAASGAGVSPDQLHSVLGRHLARLLEARIVGEAMVGWLQELKPYEPAAIAFTIPPEGAGAGLVCGPRGALGHWVQIENKVISRYQLVVPTTWNGSPQDAAGVPGPIEQALIGTAVKDAENPFEIVRIVRSFDPCLACSVHVLTARGEDRGAYWIA